MSSRRVKDRMISSVIVFIALDLVSIGSLLNCFVTFDWNLIFIVHISLQSRYVGYYELIKDNGGLIPPTKELKLKSMRIHGKTNIIDFQCD